MVMLQAYPNSTTCSTAAPLCLRLTHCHEEGQQRLLLRPNAWLKRECTVLVEQQLGALWVAVLSTAWSLLTYARALHSDGY